MNFKNDLEKRCFEVASDVLGSSVRMEHNKRIQIENALYAEVASFRGPPAALLSRGHLRSARCSRRVSL